jgi:phage terminase large subunit-like protein
MKDQTTQYAKDVLSGKIIAGKFVRLAAQRHVDDLKNGHLRGLKWEPEAAERFFRFCRSCLSITEGAKLGEPFEPLPWHKFAAGSLFGWKDENGHIRFTENYWETGKGQAKSPLMAAIAIYISGFYGLSRAEIYMIGPQKDVAKVMFNDCYSMLRAKMPERDDTLEELHFKTRGSSRLTYMVEHPASESFIVPVAESISGPKPACVLVDEVHDFKHRGDLDNWSAAIVKKHGDSFMVKGSNTPSIDQHIGTEESEKYQRVLRGENIIDSAFAFIARVDDDDNPLEDESCWVKALPALGITYDIKSVRTKVESSKVIISELLSLKRLYFGIPVGSAGFWISEDAWGSTQGEFSEDDMKGRKLHLALDLSQKNDLSALSGCWEGEKLNVKTWYYTREFELADRSTADQIPYRQLEEAGEITINTGRVIDYTFIALQVKDLTAGHEAVQLVVDSAFIEDFLRACEQVGLDAWMYEGPGEPEGVGLKVVRHAQGTRVVFEDKMLCMPVSIRHLEDHILKGSIVIESNKLTTICASNTVIVSDAQKNKAFDKKRSRGRIDGMVTIAMSVGSATGEMEARAPATPWDLDPNFSLAGA